MEHQLRELEDDLELKQLEKDFALNTRLYEQITAILEEIEPELADVHIRQYKARFNHLSFEEQNRKLVLLKRGFMKMRDEQREQKRRRERNCLQNGWNKFCDLTSIPATWKFKGKRQSKGKRHTKGKHHTKGKRHSHRV